MSDRSLQINGVSRASRAWPAQVVVMTDVVVVAEAEAETVVVAVPI